MTNSQKKYLLAIYRLTRERERIQSAEVAKTLGVSKPSTVKMVQGLIDGGYIEKEPYGTIAITQKGIDTASRLSESKNGIRKFLSSLGVSCEKAEADSLIMALSLSEESAEKIAAYKSC